MSESTTLTIRIKPQLKDNLEVIANASNRTITDHVIRLIEESVNGSCQSCGRGPLPSIVPGLTPTFQTWVRSLFTDSTVVAYVSVEVQRLDGRRAYFGQVARDYVLSDGVFNLRIDLDNSFRYLYNIPLAISEIINWKQDNISGSSYMGETSNRWIELGAINGNALIQQTLLNLSNQKPPRRKADSMRERCTVRGSLGGPPDCNQEGTRRVVEPQGGTHLLCEAHYRDLRAHRGSIREGSVVYVKDSTGLWIDPKPVYP